MLSMSIFGYSLLFNLVVCIDMYASIQSSMIDHETLLLLACIQNIQMQTITIYINEDTVEYKWIIHLSTYTHLYIYM